MRVRGIVVSHRVQRGIFRLSGVYGVYPLCSGSIPARRQAVELRRVSRGDEVSHQSHSRLDGLVLPGRHVQQIHSQRDGVHRAALRSHGAEQDAEAERSGRHAVQGVPGWIHLSVAERPARALSSGYLAPWQQSHALHRLSRRYVLSDAEPAALAVSRGFVLGRGARAVYGLHGGVLLPTCGPRLTVAMRRGHVFSGGRGELHDVPGG